jgi:hypothetical protein
MEAGNEVLDNVYGGDSDFQKIGEKEAKLYKTSVHRGLVVVFEPLMDTHEH